MFCGNSCSSSQPPTEPRSAPEPAHEVDFSRFAGKRHDRRGRGDAHPAHGIGPDFVDRR